MTSSKLFWACSWLALVTASALGAEIKREDLDTLIPNRRVKDEGMGKHAIQEDIGPYWFWDAQVDVEKTDCGERRSGTTCRIRYREGGTTTNPVDVTVVRYEVGDAARWLFHDMEGEMMVKSMIDRIDHGIVNKHGSFIYSFWTTWHARHAGAIWHNGTDTFVAVVAGRSTNFPAEIVSAYLKKVPSGMKKNDLYNKDYDAWCRIEIPRRIGDMESLDWNAFTDGRADAKPSREKWERAVLTIAYLIRPVAGKTTAEDDEFFKWYSERILRQPHPTIMLIHGVDGAIEDIKARGGVNGMTEDVKTLRKWWDKKKDAYRAEGRKHKTR